MRYIMIARVSFTTTTTGQKTSLYLLLSKSRVFTVVHYPVLEAIS